MTRFLIVCGAGGLGCGARYLIAQWANRDTFPYGTLIVNLVGAFAIGLIGELALRIPELSPNLRIALTAGFFGGFTTYSAFNHESTTLVLDGHLARGFANILATLAGCAVAGLLGMLLARRLTG